MEKIYLKGKHADKFALIDDEDFEKASKYKWYNSIGYARSVKWDSKNKKMIFTQMHNLIMNPSKNMQVDHINRDRLDNRRENLRIVTRQQNQWNKKKTKGTSIYKGVNWHKQTQKWTSQIKRRVIGDFQNERHAAMAYDIFAKELYGEFAYLNFQTI